MDTIVKSRKASIESAAKLVARSIETNYQISLAKGEGETLSTSGSCMNLADIDKDEYKACTYTIDDKGKAKVNLEGTDSGKFSEYVCCGATTSTAECTTLVTDISACPNAVVVDEDEDEELVYTPEACFTTEDVDGGVKITSYKLSTIKSYDIDKNMCLTYIPQFFSGLSESDLDKLCSNEEVTYNSVTGNLLAHIGPSSCGYTYDQMLSILMYNDIIKNVTYNGDCTNDIVIPEQINNKDVVEIGEGAFTQSPVLSYNNEDNMVSLNNTTNIEPEFMGSVCYKGLPITSVTLPSKLKKIGNYAFYYHAFKSVVIPDSVTVIGDDAFDYFNTTNLELDCGLTSITIGKSVTAIGNGAFFGNLLTSVVIPDSVTSIGEQAFDNNEITSLTLGKNVTTIGYRAFMSNSLSTINLPNSLVTIGEDAFRQNSLTSVVLPDSVEEVGVGAFRQNNITSLTLGKNVATIGNKAFQTNSGLLQSGITDNHTNYLTVGTDAFDNEIVLSNSNISS